MKQEISRRHQGWALDDVEITSDITRWTAPEDVKESPLDGGVYICGIFLEGADWDTRGQKLQDLRPGMISVSLPVCCPKYRFKLKLLRCLNLFRSLTYPLCLGVNVTTTPLCKSLFSASLR